MRNATNSALVVGFILLTILLGLRKNTYIKLHDSLTG